MDGRVLRVDRRRRLWLPARPVAIGLNVLAVIGSLGGSTAEAGTYVGSASNFERINHPGGYTGDGGEILFAVCVNPDADDAEAKIAPLLRAIETWNALSPETGQTLLFPDSGVPEEELDFESITLHEFGHVLRLDHTNMFQKYVDAGEPILAIFLANQTNSEPGTNGQFDSVSIGDDGVWGTGDDERGDDDNLLWFRTDSNDPFDPMLPAVVDPNTYSVDLADLPTIPGFDQFATNATLSASNNSSLPFPDNTRAAMYDFISAGMYTRGLAADDVATVRMGMAGLNEIQGDADDYTVRFEYSPLYPACDIRIEDIATLGGGIARTVPSTPDVQIGSSNHYSGSQGFQIEVARDKAFFFGDSPDLQVTKTDEGVVAAPGDTIQYTIAVTNGGTVKATEVVVAETVPAGTALNLSLSDNRWTCGGTVEGSGCELQLGDLAPSGSSGPILFVVDVNDPATVGEVENTAFADALEGDENPLDDLAVETTPLTIPCNGDTDIVLTTPSGDPVIVYEACNSITAGTSYTIVSGRNVSFRARNRIALTPGFSVESGATFEAAIDPLAGQ